MKSTAVHGAGPVESRRASRTAAASFGMVILLIIQYILGISYNLYGTAPTASKSISYFSSPVLAAHVILGTLLIVAAVYLAVIAIRARERLAASLSVIGLLAILGAWINGNEFAANGQSGYSMAMGVLMAVALLCYAVNVGVRVFGRVRAE